MVKSKSTAAIRVFKTMSRIVLYELCAKMALTVKMLAASKDTSNQNDMHSRLSIVRSANSPKRAMGHILGAKKINFFNSRY